VAVIPAGASVGGVAVPARLSVLSCPPPLCPHLEFAVAAELEHPVSLRWSAQPADPGALTAAVDLAGPAGLAGRLAAKLRALGPVRYDISEGPTMAAEAERYSYTPDLGLFRASLAANGDVVVAEGQLRGLLAASHDAGGAGRLVHGLERLLGTAWDEELEPLRQGGSGAPISWLRRTG